jgi:hypothetical protein
MGMLGGAHALDGIEQCHGGEAEEGQQGQGEQGHQPMGDPEPPEPARITGPPSRAIRVLHAVHRNPPTVGRQPE